MNLLFLLVPKFHIFHIICKAEFAGLFLFFFLFAFCVHFFSGQGKLVLLGSARGSAKFLENNFHSSTHIFAVPQMWLNPYRKQKRWLFGFCFMTAKKKVKHSKIKSFFARAKKLNLIFYQRKCPCPRTFVTAL